MNTNHTFRYPAALTVAGSDSSGGAGIQADIKTFSALGVYAASVITAVTAQNTRGVRAVEPVTPSVLQAQWAAVWEDMQMDAVKIGMLYTSGAVRVVREALDIFPPVFTVLDPVLLSTSGHVLLEKTAVTEMVKRLFPRVSLLTPNLDEAAYLTGIPIRREEDVEKAAACLLETGCPAVLIKGGHALEEKERIGEIIQPPNELPNETLETVTDLLFIAGQPPRRFTAQRVLTQNSHGTGCTLSSAITAYMALGYSLPDAVEGAKKYMTAALSAGADVETGGGHGPVNHFFNPVPLHKIRS